MHILLIHQAFTSLNEPGGTRHHEFARYLANAGHTVSIIASPISYLTGKNTQNKKIESELNGSITIYRAYTYPSLHKSFVHRLFSFFSFMISAFFISLKITKVDLIWGTSPPIFQAFAAWCVAKVKRKPFLLEIRDLWPAFAVAVGVLTNKTLINMSLWLERFLYRHADKLIVNSPGFIDHIREKGGKDITLIPNGADPASFHEIDRESTRKRLGWDDDFIFLYAGAHGMSNDLSVIIQAANLLKSQTNIKFVFVGDGKEKNNLIDYAESLILSNVEFINSIPKNKISEYLQASNACIAILKPIDLYKTTYPNKVFDYMAAGRPILLAIDGVIRDVVESANCGYFCEPGNPQAFAETALKMAKYHDQMEKLGSNGKAYLQKNFNRTKIAKSFTDMIKNMVDQND